jgi:hypothetical protein
MQFRITGIDLAAMALVVSCPRCKAAPGQPCDFKASRDWNQHKARGDKADRQRTHDLYGCRRCEYACDCSPNAARWLPSSTIIVL